METIKVKEKDKLIIDNLNEKLFDKFTIKTLITFSKTYFTDETTNTIFNLNDTCLCSSIQRSIYNKKFIKYVNTINIEYI